jgi:hypothetical protein
MKSRIAVKREINRCRKLRKLYADSEEGNAHASLIESRIRGLEWVLR